MPLTADDVWDQFVLEEDVPDLTPSIKYEWIDVLNQDLYRAMFEADPEPYIEEQTIPIGAIRLALTSITGTFTVGETVTGGTSGATGEVVSWSSPNLTLKDIDGTFDDSEVVTGGTSSAFGTISTNTDVTEFDLDADFEEIIPNYCGLFLYDSDGRQTQELHLTSKGSQQEGFYLNNVAGTITITGTPTADDWTLRFIPRKAEITVGTQNLVIPDRLKHKCKRIFFHALSEMYKSRDERSTGDIQPDQIYKKSYFDEFVKLFQPSVKTIKLNPYAMYYNSRFSRRNINRDR